MRAKWRWMRNGAVVGLMLLIADYVMQWPGSLYLPWEASKSVAFNIGKIVGVMIVPALIGFAFGTLRDQRAKT